jgi:hypothetical protein
VFGNFAALNELAAKSSSQQERRRKGPSKVRKPKVDPKNNMADIMNQFNTGDLAELMGQLGGDSKLSEMLEGLVDQNKLEEMMKSMEGTDQLELYHTFITFFLYLSHKIHQCFFCFLFFSSVPSTFSFSLGMDMSSLMEMSMKMMKGALEDNPEIQSLLENPDELKKAMLPFVEAMGGDVEKLDEMLKDKETIKSTMREGVEVMKRSN